MELEQRVQALEQEVQILKNQIQVTLLDIQEQLLTNAYPTLRTEDIPPMGGNGRPHSRSDSPPPETSTNIRRVVLDETEDASPTNPAPPKVVPVRARTPDVQWSTLAEMEAWVNSKVKEIGASRTEKLIDMYAQKGEFAPEVIDTLLEFMALYSEEAVPKSGKTHSPARNGAAPVQPMSSRLKRETPPETRAQPVASVQSAPSRPKRETPSETRPQPAARPPSKKATQTRPAVRPQAAPKSTGHAQPPKAEARNTAKVEPTAPAEGEPRQNIVLRLIAGVQNAGAGVKWRKNNG